MRPCRFSCFFRRTVAATAVCCLALFPAFAGEPASKTEFRGAWISTMYQPRFASMGEVQLKQYFRDLLDSLQAVGVNAVMFQVRGECDAWYKSSYEPWSRHISGKAGRNPQWDPLAFMVEECHARCLDLHAWINPYRVRQTATEADSKDVFVRRHSSWILSYGRSLWLDPGRPECREHIVRVVREIVRQYDVDGVHLDDYFYPYPVAGQTFPDEASYAAYGGGLSRSDWRRRNVNLLVEALHRVVREEKPYVSLGISPFGIHRNLKQDPQGSLTDGLSNYDDLYADALTWMQEGWIDYCIPQLYWEIGHPKADYAVLVDWWASCPAANTSLYVGHDLARSLKPGQLGRKLEMERRAGSYRGHCFFPAYELETNQDGRRDSLRRVWHPYPALLPADVADTEARPEPVYGLDVYQDLYLGPHLTWKSVADADPLRRSVRFVVYRFYEDEPIDLNDPSRIVAVTHRPLYIFPTHPRTGRWTYVVTSLNRFHRESAGEQLTIRVK